MGDRVGYLRDGCAAPHWTQKAHPMAGCRAASLTFSHTSPIAGVERSQDCVARHAVTLCALMFGVLGGGLVSVLCSAS